MILLALPLGEISFFGLLLIGIGFGPIFPSVLHSVPERFGKEYLYYIGDNLKLSLSDYTGDTNQQFQFVLRYQHSTVLFQCIAPLVRRVVESLFLEEGFYFTHQCLFHVRLVVEWN